MEIQFLQGSALRLQNVSLLTDSGSGQNLISQPREIQAGGFKSDLHQEERRFRQSGLLVLWQQSWCFMTTASSRSPLISWLWRHAAALFHLSDRLWRCGSTSQSVSSFILGASGEDQTPPEPVCCVSKWIEGLQHLTAGKQPPHTHHPPIPFQSLSILGKRQETVHQVCNTRIYARECVVKRVDLQLCPKLR